jgi:hypothetical protein
LREFKHFGREFGRLVVGAVQSVQLQLDGRQPVPKLGVLLGEGVLIHSITESEVQQVVLPGARDRALRTIAAVGRRA